jgi:RimJ/RimL family protein N-acetyltransferase
MMYLVTPSSIIRPWVLSDSESLVRHADKPQIAENMRDGFPYPYTLQDARQFITMATGDHQHIFLAIEIGGEAVGGIGLHIFDDVYRQTAEVGYWLSEQFWNKGIVSDAVRIFLPTAFKERDIIRIQAGVFGTNPASMKVLENCGFVKEAIHKRAITKQGKILDEHLYVIFREQVIRPLPGYR